jgi:hypothetical protein
VCRRYSLSGPQLLHNGAIVGAASMTPFLVYEVAVNKILDKFRIVDADLFVDSVWVRAVGVRLMGQFVAFVSCVLAFSVNITSVYISKTFSGFA